MTRTGLGHWPTIGLALLLAAWRPTPVASQGTVTAADTARAQRADSAPRAGQAGTGVTAGYNRGFFIRSADGNNELRMVLVSQLRYAYNHRDAGASTDEAEDLDFGGIQLRRVQLDLQGHFLNPRWTFRLRLDASSGGTVGAAWAWAGYRFSDRLGIRVGQFKPSFLYEEDVSGSSQLAAERSYTADYFTTDFSQGAQATLQPLERLRVVGTVHTGSYSARTDFLGDGTDAALAGRVELLLGARDVARAWRQFTDFPSWSGDQAAVLLSGAYDYEWGETQVEGGLPDISKGAVEIVAKLGRFGLFGSAIVQQFSVPEAAAEDVPANLEDATQVAVVIQGSGFVARDRVEPFARFEWIDFDGVYYRNSTGGIQSDSRDLAEPSDLGILTAGLNYYLARHGAKLTLDAQYALDPVPVTNLGGALLRSAAGDQLAVRCQLQVRF